MAWLGDSVLFEKLNPVDRSAHPLIELKGGYMVFDSGGELPITKTHCEPIPLRKLQPCAQTNAGND